MERLLCPSSKPDARGKVIGVVKGYQAVQLIDEPFSFDEEAIKAGEGKGPLDGRFRFAAICQKAACNKWTGKNCGLISSLVDDESRHNIAPVFCPIVKDCRWHQEHGVTACTVCSSVVRHTQRA